MSSFWSLWITILTLGVILGCWFFLWIVRRSQPSDEVTDESVGHEFDGIEELDNPLPKWWYGLFVATIVFSLVYLALYPGLGNYQGLLGWSQVGQYEDERAAAEDQYAPLFAQYADTPVEELAGDPEAMSAGQRLFSNHCAICHGSAGRGSVGFPNLTDDVWQWGGEPEDIYKTLKEGRRANMPARGTNPNLTNDELQDITHFVLALNDRAEDEEAAERGQEHYQNACAACHGPEGKGNAGMGAPDLTDDVWLYGGSFDAIMESLRLGRQGHMPAQDNLLSDDQIHLLTAYVLRLAGRHQDGE